MAPRLYRVIVPVRDIRHAAAFYSALLGIDGKRVSPGRHYFNCGGTILACFDPRADGDPFELPSNPDHIYLAVGDLERYYASAAALDCRSLEDSIKTRPWGERSFYLQDPFGNRLCFVDETTVFLGD